MRSASSREYSSSKDNSKLGSPRTTNILHELKMMNNVFMDDLSEEKMMKLAKFLASTNQESRERIMQEMEAAGKKEAEKVRNASIGRKLRSPRVTVTKRGALSAGSSISLTNKILAAKDPVDRERLILTRVSQLMGAPHCPIE